ncbi:hypothetical protein OHU34_42655 [Streptomyces sp. NBC_00080]|uniref:hypothetical protein n=1 Tax=Streptomyces sp. NBC_00080 TaxID=2975645 RepID=UPI00324DF901
MPKTKRGYKWVDRAMRELDPETEYEQIIRLMGDYQLNATVLDLVVSASTIHNIVHPRGSETLAHTGKIVSRRDKRAEDGYEFFWTWFANGPSSDVVKESVARLNRMHLGIARQLPGNFSYNEDFVFTLCQLGVFNHRLQKLLGLPGMPDHLKIAFHHWMRDMSALFVGEHGPVTGFPEDFDAMLAFVEDYESQPYEHSENGLIVSEGIIQGFVERNFPKRLWPFGRAMVLTTVPEPIRRLHHLPDPNRSLAASARLLLKTQMRLQKFLPDPREGASEKYFRERAALMEKRKAERLAAHGVAAAELSEEGTSGGGLCPVPHTDRTAS